MTTQNQALLDELEAVNSIYNENTCIVNNDAAGTDTVSITLTLPDLPYSFLILFPPDYPEIPPEVLGTQSTGTSTKIGQGEAAASLLRDVLGSIFVAGQVCLFDLIEETSPLLKQDTIEDTKNNSKAYEGGINDDTVEDHSDISANRSDDPRTDVSTQLQALHVHDLTSSLNITSPAITALTDWIVADPLVVNKSTFVGRALAVRNLQEATDSISYLLATNKRVANATHNVTAWRIKQIQSVSDINSSGKPQPQPTPEFINQDFDDDGETAAGGRLLRLMQSMDVWNVVVVVTRWYGGVKLGPDRFRCINNVAKDALIKGGFGRDENEGKSGGGKGKSKKK